MANVIARVQQARRWSSPTTRPWRRSSATSSASSCRTTRSSTSSATTTTTSPRRTCRRSDTLHREGLVHQRRDRPPAPRGHQRAVPAPRRGHRRQRELHLRPGLAGGVPGAHGAPPGGPDRRARRDAAQAGRHPLRAQRLRARARQVPGARRLGRDLARPTQDTAHARAALGRRDRAARQLRPGRAARCSRSRARRHLSGHALRHQRPGHRARAGRDPQRDGGALRLVRGERQDPRGASPAPAHAVRHGDAARDGLLQRHRELLAHPARQAARRHAQLPARLLPGRLPAASSTSRTCRCRRCAP